MTGFGEHKKILSDDEQAALIEALRAIRIKVCWKPGKDVVHHQKRQNMGHLPASCSLAGYEEHIHDIVRNVHNIVYIYDFSGIYFYAVRGFKADNEWPLFLVRVESWKPLFLRKIWMSIWRLEALSFWVVLRRS